MFCEECGQLIAFEVGTEKLIHKTLVPITDHEPMMCESDRRRYAP